jgi:oxygen-independent coproporphyrinogen-3 oxidase
MGYSPRRADTLVAVGASAISASRNAFAQNAHDLKAYLAGVARGSAVERGCILTEDDVARQAVIEGIMTRGRVTGRDATAYVVDPEELRALERDGMLGQVGDDLELTALGRLFARNVASCFDTYRAGERSRHASAV